MAKMGGLTILNEKVLKVYLKCSVKVLDTVRIAEWFCFVAVTVSEVLSSQTSFTESSAAPTSCRLGD